MLERETLPGVLTLERPSAGSVPVIYDSPHSGDVFPADFGTIVPHDILRAVQDSHVDALFARVTESGASLLKALFPRSYIDPNRAVDDLDSRLLAKPWPTVLHPTEKSRLGHGLVWRTCPADRAMYDRRLTVSEVEGRINNYWGPYHKTLSDEFDRLENQFGRVWHVNCHSMPNGSSPIVTRKRGSNRADIVLGDRDGRSADGEFTHFIRERLEALGYVVRLNDPYKGAYLVQAYSDPRWGRNSVQVEINRSIYMDESNLELKPDFDRLGDDLTTLSLEIAQFALDRVIPQAAE